MKADSNGQPVASSYTIAEVFARLKKIQLIELEGKRYLINVSAKDKQLVKAKGLEKPLKSSTYVYRVCNKTMRSVQKPISLFHMRNLPQAIDWIGCSISNDRIGPPTKQKVKSFFISWYVIIHFVPYILRSTSVRSDVIASQCPTAYVRPFFVVCSGKQNRSQTVCLDSDMTHKVSMLKTGCGIGEFRLEGLRLRGHV